MSWVLPLREPSVLLLPMSASLWTENVEALTHVGLREDTAGGRVLTLRRGGVRAAARLVGGGLVDHFFF